jgi:putative acetyltransferase
MPPASARRPLLEDQDNVARIAVAEIVVTTESPSSNAALHLVEGLARELRERYGDAANEAFYPADVQVPGGAFVIAWLGERPLGFGAFGPLRPGVGELKRVFVEKDVRQQGVGGRILGQLEAVARRTGYDALRVAPRVTQPEAVHLYTSAGYAPIPRYGRYVDDPLYLCLEKRLDV